VSLVLPAAMPQDICMFSSLTQMHVLWAQYLLQCIFVACGIGLYDNDGRRCKETQNEF